jgi:DNA-binding MarR family transcriptional regulator
MAKKQEQTKLKPNEVKILEALVKTKEASRAELKEATGIVKGYSKLIGGLEVLKLVDTTSYEDIRSMFHSITPMGRKALEKHRKDSKTTTVKVASKTNKKAKKVTAKKATTKKATKKVTKKSAKKETVKA